MAEDLQVKTIRQIEANGEESAAGASSSHIRIEIDKQLSSPPPISKESQEKIDRVLSEMSQHKDDFKKAMTPEQLKSVDTLEGLVLNGDFNGVKSFMTQFKDNPRGSEPVMLEVLHDLYNHGLDVTWDITPGVPQIGKWGKLGPAEIGNLTIGMPDGDKDRLASVRFSTDGFTFAMHQDAESRRFEDQLPPEPTLRMIRDSWIRDSFY